MKNKCIKLYRKLFSHTPSVREDIDLLSDEHYRNKEYNFYFISSASLSIISATFFIGMLSFNFKSAGVIELIEIYLSIFSFSMSLSLNSFFLFSLFISSSNELDKVETIIIFKYRIFGMFKFLSFTFPFIGMFFLISYFSFLIAFFSLISFFVMNYCYDKLTKKAKRRANEI